MFKCWSGEKEEKRRNQKKKKNSEKKIKKFEFPVGPSTKSRREAQKPSKKKFKIYFFSKKI